MPPIEAMEPFGTTTMKVRSKEQDEVEELNRQIKRHVNEESRNAHE